MVFPIRLGGGRLVAISRGFKLGGYLAPRAASGEHRLAACVADPGQWDMLEAMRAFVARFSVPQEIVDRLPDVDPEDLQPVFGAIEASPQLTWTFERRGLWVHGVDSVMDWLRITPNTASRTAPTRYGARPS